MVNRKKRKKKKQIKSEVGSSCLFHKLLIFTVQPIIIGYRYSTRVIQLLRTLFFYVATHKQCFFFIVLSFSCCCFYSCSAECDRSRSHLCNGETIWWWCYILCIQTNSWLPIGMIQFACGLSFVPAELCSIILEWDRRRNAKVTYFMQIFLFFLDFFFFLSLILVNLQGNVPL